MALEDAAYTEWLRRRGCCAPMPHRCEGDPQIHHTKYQLKGLGLRAHDHEGIPLCWRAHMSIENPAIHGPFMDWDKPRRKAWEAEQVAEHRAAFLSLSDGSTF